MVVYFLVCSVVLLMERRDILWQMPASKKNHCFQRLRSGNGKEVKRGELLQHHAKVLIETPNLFLYVGEALEGGAVEGRVPT